MGMQYLQDYKEACWGMIACRDGWSAIHQSVALYGKFWRKPTSIVSNRLSSDMRRYVIQGATSIGAS